VRYMTLTQRRCCRFESCGI